jgi:hypothetical protein
MAISKAVTSSVNQPLEGPAGGGPNTFGQPYISKVTGLSSDVVLAAQNLLTAYNGDIEIDNCILETDGTGFAGGTNVQLGTDDTIGLAVFMAETVANLGANKTVDINSASVTKQRTVIHSGKHLQISSTVGACTGAGVWNLYVVWRPALNIAASLA